METTTTPRPFIIVVNERQAALIERTLHEKVEWLIASGEAEEAAELADLSFEILCAASDAGVEFPAY